MATIIIFKREGANYIKMGKICIKSSIAYAYHWPEEHFSFDEITIKKLIAKLSNGLKFYNKCHYLRKYEIEMYKDVKNKILPKIKKYNIDFVAKLYS